MLRINVYLLLSLTLVQFVQGQGVNNKTLDQKISDAFSLLRTDSVEHGYERIQEIKLIINKRELDTLSGEVYRISGEFNNSMGNFDLAVQDFTRAIEIFEEIGYTQQLSTSYSGLGNTYLALENNAKAKEYYLLSQQLAVEHNQMDSWARVSINLCNILISEQEYDKALQMLQKAQSIFYKEKSYSPAAIAMLMEANVYISKGDVKKADQILRELSKNKKLVDNYYVSSNLYSMRATVAEKLGDINQAIDFQLKSLKFSLHGKAMHDASHSYKTVSEYFERIDDYPSAFKYYKEHVKLKDSLLTQENLNSIAEAEAKFSSTRKEKELIEKDLILKEKDLRLQQEQQLKAYYLFGGAVVVLLSFFFAFRFFMKKKSFSKLQSLHKQLEGKSKVIEQKNSEITDSILYAQKLQEAILSDLLPIKEFGVKDYFLLYRPKDIVAGDFYWSKESKDGSRILIAVADCTGHGVPGAMVSVVCGGALNQATREVGYTNTAAILDRVRDLVTKTFSKKNNKLMDGMDIALLSLEKPSGKGGAIKANFSGANNPLWVVRSKSQEIEEFKANKQPIGKYQHQRPFNMKSLEFKSGDCAYLFTDGYADQFGYEVGGNNNPGGKKFKTKNLKKLLVDCSDKSISDQRYVLVDTLDSWMSELDQVDDICILGMRFK